MASSVTESHAHDPSHVPALLAQVDRELERFIGDGISDQAPVSDAVTGHAPGAKAIMPPRKDAVVRPEAATSPTPRDHHLFAMQRTERFHWKRRSGADAQRHAENAFSR